MNEEESSNEMNRAIRGSDTPPEELLNAHERLAVEGLRAGVVPELAEDLWRLVGTAADLPVEAEIDAAAAVAEIKATRPQLFDDEQTAFNRTLRGAGLPAYTPVPASSRPGSANGGVRAMPSEPRTMSDEIRDSFRRHRSGGRGTGWEA
jgi:hypothetical protein